MDHHILLRRRFWWSIIVFLILLAAVAIWRVVRHESEVLATVALRDEGQGVPAGASWPHRADAFLSSRGRQVIGATLVQPFTIR